MALTLTRSGKSYFHTYSDGTKVIHSGRTMDLGVNTQFVQRWNQTHCFINLLKHMDLTNPNTANPGTKDANGYVDASISGTFTMIGMDGDYMYAGNWIITWDGVAGTDTCYLSDGASEITLTYDGPNEGTPVNRCEYSITGSTGGTVNISCTGAPTNMQFFHEDDETDLDNGNILTSRFKSDWSGIDNLRFMDQQATNNNGDRDYAADEITPYGYHTWGFNRYGGGGYTPASSAPPLGVPQQALAEQAVELDCDAWINIPHQLTDSAVTSWATDFWDNLTAGWKSSHIIYVEYGNEPWQSGANAAFADFAQYATFLDGTVVEATYDETTATATATTHGLVDGDAIRCFNTVENGDWPWARGGQRYAIYVDADNFKTGSNYTVTAATEAAQAQLTVSGHPFEAGDTVRLYNMSGGTWSTVDGNDYTVQSDDSANTFTINLNSTSLGTFSAGNLLQDDTERRVSGIITGPSDEVGSGIRYIAEKTSSNTKAVNYATRATEVWDLCEAVFGSNMRRVAGGWFNDGAGVTWASGMMAVDAMKSDHDFFAIAPYRNAFAFMTQLIDGQDETRYDNSGANDGEFTGGSGYSVSDVITLSSGCTVTVDAVSSGVVTEFTVSNTGQTATSPSLEDVTQTQTSVSPSGGTGFELLPDANNIEEGDLFVSATNAQILQSFKDNYPAEAQSTFDALTAALGHARVICYEGGDSGGNNSSKSYDAAQVAAVKSWRDSNEMKEWYEFYLQTLSGLGITVFDQYTCAGVRNPNPPTEDENEWWGLMEYIGQTDSKRYLGYQPYIANGAPKPKS